MNKTYNFAMKASCALGFIHLNANDKLSRINRRFQLGKSDVLSVTLYVPIELAISNPVIGWYANPTEIELNKITLSAS